MATRKPSTAAKAVRRSTVPARRRGAGAAPQSAGKSAALREDATGPRLRKRMQQLLQEADVLARTTVQLLRERRLAVAAVASGVSLVLLRALRSRGGTG